MVANLNDRSAPEYARNVAWKVLEYGWHNGQSGGALVTALDACFRDLTEDADASLVPAIRAAWQSAKAASKVRRHCGPATIVSRLTLPSRAVACE